SFSDTTGRVTTNDTIVIHITNPDAAPTIVTQPVGLTMAVSGQKATLNVEATGTGPLHYQWYSGISPNAGNPIEGATSSTFTTQALVTGGQYLYWVQVSNAGGVVNSLNATVNVMEPTTITATVDPTALKYSPSDRQVIVTATVSRQADGAFGIADGGVTFA